MFWCSVRVSLVKGLVTGLMKSMILLASWTGIYCQSLSRKFCREPYNTLSKDSLLHFLKVSHAVENSSKRRV